MKKSLVAAAILMVSGWAAAQDQSTFATPQEAVQAVIQACQHNDTDALLKIFGPDGRDIVESGDSSDDRDGRAQFAQLTIKKMKLVADPANANKMILSIGDEDWPFPVPLVRDHDRWRFDSAEGRQEILARRIGANELAAIDICKGYVEAQFEYAHTHQQKGVPIYARKISDFPGEQVSKGFARAAPELVEGSTEPYHGYYFKVLTAQGPDARGGAVDYLANNAMIGGFGLIAWPARYGVSGVQTFVINHEGIVWEKAQGPDSGKIAAETTTFNPDKFWHPL